MPTVTITGGTGLIGRAVGQALLEKGYRVIILSRETEKKTSHAGLSYAKWDVNTQYIDETAIRDTDHIIHLAGAGIADKRWSAKRKKEILESRVNGSKLIVHALKTIPNKVQSVISASAIGWYGADPAIPNPKPFEETDLPADNFLGNTCKQWEESIEPVTELGKRLVKLRTGIVLSKEGGALKEFIKPMKWGIAAILGNGKQIISWIHIDDLVKLYIDAIENESMKGSYNAVAPEPVSNKELTIKLAKLRKKIFIPIHVPSFVLQIVVGEMSIEVLKSTTVSCKKISAAGFHFIHPSIESALQEVVS